MLEDIKNKKIDVIIIKDLSRLGRNYIETGNFIEVIFPGMGVSVISVDENCEIDSSDYYGDDYLPLKNLFNDTYAKDISKKVRSSLIVKKYNGEFVGKLAPYGYIKDPKDKHKFLIDKNVSHIIKKIFNMILNGKSRREVADFLNDNDILTPSEYLKINTDKDTTIMKKWNPEMVNSILRNENYTGTLFQGKKRKLNYRIDKKIKLDKENWIVTENHHEAIISKEDFDKVQEILDRKSKVNKDGSIDLLSGILKCKCCGSNMIKRTSKGKVYYYCSNYYRTKKCENNKSIPKSIVEEFIKKELNINECIDKIIEDKSYKNYGGKGISVCEEWSKSFSSFALWAEENGYAEGLTIDRIDGKKGYSPENCRWVTVAEQNRNYSKNHFITYNGETKCLADWADFFGLKRATVLFRIKQGKPLNEVFEKTDGRTKRWQKTISTY